MIDIENDQEWRIIQQLLFESDMVRQIYVEGSFMERNCGQAYVAFKKEKFKDFNNFLSEAVYFGFNVNDKFRNGKDLYDLISEHNINDDLAFFEMLYTIKSLGDFDFNSKRLLKSKNAEMIEAFNNPVILKPQKGEYNEQSIFKF